MANGLNRLPFGLAFTPIASSFALLAADFAASPWLGHADSFQIERAD